MFKGTYVGLTSIIIFFFSFMISAIFNRIIISIQRKKLEGQVISIYLLDSHQNKKLTPTLGGVAIIVSIVISTFIHYESYFKKQFWAVLLVMLSFFLIGLFDDIIKVKKRDYHGLSAIIRFLLEFLIGLLAYLCLENHYDFSNLNIFGNISIHIGAIIILLFPFILVGSANSVNLTDGLDGLSSSLYLLAIIPFILFSLISKEYYLTYLLVSSFGAVLGFITFNLHPSKIFMGDSGSLSLGSLLGISALILHKEMYLIISAGLFIFETISVILQVIYFKISKKRLFLMAPFHHHLEMKGLKEYQIVMIFFVIGLVLSFISVFIGIII